MNIGYDKEEIEFFKKECEAEDSNYLIVEDEEGLGDSPEFAHFQFIGKYEGKEVIYDALMATLAFHFDSTIWNMALERLAKELNTDPESIDTEKYEEDLFEIMDEIEDEEGFKVAESVEIDPDFEYGVGIEVQLNVPEITHEVIVEFIENFNNNTLDLDKTLYSFTEDTE